MRDWILPMVPVMAIAYFVAYPDQFGVFVSWIENYVH
jgi:hypothetical protein